MSLDGYDLDVPIVSTATGTVARGRQRSTGRAVAVKRVSGVHPAIAGRLRHEADVLASIHHPHVVALLDVIEDPDGLALVMPWAEGGSLEAQLAAGRRFDPEEVAALLRRLAGGLAAAHRRGVLHLDLKPANVLLTEDGEPLLADFGVARWRGRSCGHVVSGTPGFVAPEVAAGDEPDERADVYGLGARALALLGGAPADGALGQVVDRCLRIDPAERFPSADAVAAALGGRPLPTPIAAAAGATGVDTVDFGPRPPRAAIEPDATSTRLPSVAVAAAAAVIAIVSGAFALTRPGPPPAAAASCPRPPHPGPGEIVVHAPHRGACAPAVLWSSATATATVVERGHRVRYALGEPGDQLALARVGAALGPVLYRPSTGRVYVFAGWAAPGRPLPSTAPRQEVAGGRIEVVSDGDRDRIVVRPSVQS
jgi:hypothetical protein